MGRINHLAVLVTVVLQQAIGFVWYHYGFGPAWMAGVGITADRMQPTATVFVVAIVAAFLFSYTVAWLLRMTRSDSWFDGFKIGLVLAFAVAGGAIATHYGFLSIRPIVAAIDIGRELVGGAVTGLVLGIWRKR